MLINLLDSTIQILPTKKLFLFVSFVIFAFFLLGCQPTIINKASSNLTMGKVKMEIKKGYTTQAEILQIFGSPNIVTKNRSNDEVWNYNRMSYEATYGSQAAGMIFWGGSSAFSSTTSSSFDLIIIFDENDIVKDYSVIAASF